MQLNFYIRIVLLLIVTIGMIFAVDLQLQMTSAAGRGSSLSLVHLLSMPILLMLILLVTFFFKTKKIPMFFDRFLLGMILFEGLSGLFYMGLLLSSENDRKKARQDAQEIAIEYAKYADQKLPVKNAKRLFSREHQICVETNQNQICFHMVNEANWLGENEAYPLAALLCESEGHCELKGGRHHCTYLGKDLFDTPLEVLSCLLGSAGTHNLFSYSPEKGGKLNRFEHDYYAENNKQKNFVETDLGGIKPEVFDWHQSQVCYFSGVSVYCEPPDYLKGQFKESFYKVAEPKSAHLWSMNGRSFCHVSRENDLVCGEIFSDNLAFKKYSPDEVDFKVQFRDSMQLVVEDYDICLLSRNGIYCGLLPSPYGRKFAPMARMLERVSKPQSIAIANRVLCALRPDGKVDCTRLAM